MAQLVEINQIGKREDLRDFISIVDMKEKPLLAMIPKIPEAMNMLMSWQADSYAAPITTGVADGVDVESYENSAQSRGLIQNYCQKWRRTAMVGDIAENVSNVAGAKAGELARAIDKKFEEIGRDMEATLCSDNAAQLETSSATPYKTRGLGDWIKTTAQTVLPVPTAYLTPTASVSTGALTETGVAPSLQAFLTSIYIQYGKSSNLVMLAGTTVKLKITNFNQAGVTASSNVRFFSAAQKDQAIVQSVDSYTGDFNNVEVHPSLLLGITSGSATPGADRFYILPMEALGLAFNRPPKVQRLPNLGGGPRAYVDAIAGLVVKNPLVFAKGTTIS